MEFVRCFHVEPFDSDLSPSVNCGVKLARLIGAPRRPPLKSQSLSVSAHGVIDDANGWTAVIELRPDVFDYRLHLLCCNFDSSRTIEILNFRGMRQCRECVVPCDLSPRILVSIVLQTPAERCRLRPSRQEPENDDDAANEDEPPAICEAA